MTIGEAMCAVNDEYSEECERAKREHPFNLLLQHAIGAEYVEIDQQLPSYVGEIMGALLKLPIPGRVVIPPEVYQLARMCFRMGMRVQRKLDHPEERSSLFWRSDQEVS